MKHLLLASLVLATAACSSMPSLPFGQPSGFTEEAMPGGKVRIAYEAPSADVTRTMAANRTLARAAQVTLDKGNEWFEIASKIDGKNTQTLVIVMGKGETLAGGPKPAPSKPSTPPANKPPQTPPPAAAADDADPFAP